MLDYLGLFIHGVTNVVDEGELDADRWYLRLENNESFELLENFVSNGNNIVEIIHTTFST